MKENKFLDKFSNKSNSELREIILEKEKYNSTAVDAAKELLKKRKTNENSTKTNNIDSEKTSIVIENKNEEVVENLKNLPELYSKKTILIFSILFTPLVGSLLMSSNLKKLQNTNGQSLVLIFGVLFNTVCFKILKYYNLELSFWIIINLIGAVIFTKYFWNLLIGDDFEYSKRTNKTPFLIILGTVLTFILLLILIVVIS